MAVPGTDDDLDDGAPALGTVLEGRYQLIARLGEGGVGWVYRAKHLRLGTEVAIKMLQAPYDHHESLRPRFEREAQALAQLRHPNIVTMTDYSVTEGRPYLVMELLEGRTLAELIEEGPIPEARARHILRQVLDALIYAHGRGFAHRDLKPSNVFLVELPTDPDHVKILDFGFVKLMSDVDEQKRPALTVSGIAFGTPSYMCPEQATGAPTDPRADLYSAGIVFFEMLSGRRPFVGEIPEVIRAHLTQPVPRLTVRGLEAGRELRALVERALAKSPTERFQSASEMRDALDALPTPALVRDGELRALEQAETVPPPAPRLDASPPRAAPARARSRPIGLAIALALLVIGGGAALYLAVSPPGGTATAALGAPARVPATERAPDEQPHELGAAEREADPAPAVAELAPAVAQHVEPEPESAGAILADAGITREEGELAAIDAQDESGAEPALAEVAPLEAVDASAASPSAPSTIEPTAAPVAVPSDPWTTREPVPFLDDARRRLASGRPLSARGERALRSYVRGHRSDPRPHLLLAQHYLERGVDRGAFERYALAERVDPSARMDPRMLPDLVRLAARGSMSAEAGDLLARLYGAEAIAEVERALAGEGVDRSARERLEALRTRLRSLGP